MASSSSLPIPESENPFPSDIVNAPQCSICLEDVVENIGRSIVKLQCGHLFHLDCIGSEFNFRGMMQCPNCREIEEGNWLFRDGPEDDDEEEEEISDEEDEPLAERPRVEMRFSTILEVDAQIDRLIGGGVTVVPTRVYVLTGCAKHCPTQPSPAGGQVVDLGCTSSHSATSFPAINLECQQPVMHLVVNAPTAVAIARNTNSTDMPIGIGACVPARNGETIENILQQALENRSLFRPLVPTERPVDVNGTGTINNEVQAAAATPRNGPSSSSHTNNAQHQASGFPAEPNLELSLAVNLTYDEPHLSLRQRLESINLEEPPSDDPETGANAAAENHVQEDDDEEELRRYPDLIRFF